MKAVVLEEQDRKPNQIGKSKVVGEGWIKGRVVGGRGLRLKAKPGIAE